MNIFSKNKNEEKRRKYTFDIAPFNNNREYRLGSYLYCSMAY